MSQTQEKKAFFTYIPRALRAVLFYFIQWTWGLPQNVVGLIVLLLLGRQRRSRYHGALATIFGSSRIFPDSGAFSLGCFIFIPESWGEENCRRTLVHEYGHTVQSLILGPLYLPAVGLPSVIWGQVWSRSKTAARLMKSAPVQRPMTRSAARTARIADSRYTSRYPENWANILGKYVTGEEPAWD